MTLTAPNMEERRHFSRIKFHSRCQLQQITQHWQVQLLDISLNGLLVKVDSDPLPDEEMPISVVMELENRAKIRFNALICHREGGLMGLERQHIDLDSLSHLRRLLELNLGNAAAANRELFDLVNEYH